MKRTERYWCFCLMINSENPCLLQWYVWSCNSLLYFVQLWCECTPPAETFSCKHMQVLKWPVVLCWKLWPCRQKANVASLFMIKCLLFNSFLRGGLWVVDRRQAEELDTSHSSRNPSGSSSTLTLAFLYNFNFHSQCLSHNPVLVLSTSVFEWGTVCDLLSAPLF